MLSVAPKIGPDGRVQLHASTVVIKEAAVAFIGPSGSGKSGLALTLMARGATLLADDITWLHHQEDHLIASCPPALSGQIEARGVGILKAAASAPAPLKLIVDLGTPERDRLPPWRETELLGHKIPLLHNPETSHFIDAILQYMMEGRAK